MKHKALPSFCLTAGASLVLTALMAACSSSSSSSGAGPTASVQGTIGGRSFTLGSVVLGAGGARAANTGPAIVIFLSDHDEWSCSYAQMQHNRSNEVGLSFEAVNNGDAITAGTYAVGQPSGKNVLATTLVTDSSCHDTGTGVGSGTVTLASVSSTSVSGSFDLKFGDTDHVSGTFDGPLCTLPDSVFDKGAPSPCGS